MYYFLFVLGISVGSFLNVLIDRIPRNESFIKGRSYCESCKKKLRFFDLIPLLSFVFLKGKCRYCRVGLSVYYPLVELVTGVLFVLTALFLRITNYELLITNNLPLLFYVFMASCFIVIFFTDLKYGIIPDQIVYPAIFISFVYLLLNARYLLPNTLSAVAAFLFFLTIFLLTKKKGMGFGDVKLVFLIGLFLGYPATIIALYMAFLTGSVFSLILILLRLKKLKGGIIVFGPFLVIGTLAGLVWGDEIIKLLFRL